MTRILFIKVSKTKRRIGPCMNILDTAIGITLGWDELELGKAVTVTKSVIQR